MISANGKSARGSRKLTKEMWEGRKREKWHTSPEVGIPGYFFIKIKLQTIRDVEVATKSQRADNPERGLEGWEKAFTNEDSRIRIRSRGKNKTHIYRDIR